MTKDADVVTSAVKEGDASAMVDRLRETILRLERKLAEQAKLNDELRERLRVLEADAKTAVVHVGGEWAGMSTVEQAASIARAIGTRKASWIRVEDGELKQTDLGPLLEDPE